MDITTISLGTQTREDLAEFRDSKEYSNYNEAVKALLEQASQEGETAR